MRIAFTICTPKTGYRISSDPAGKFTFKPGRSQGANCRNQPESRIKMKIIHMPLGVSVFILEKSIAWLPFSSLQAQEPNLHIYGNLQETRALLYFLSRACKLGFRKLSNKFLSRIIHPQDLILFPIKILSCFLSLSYLIPHSLSNFILFPIKD